MQRLRDLHDERIVRLKTFVRVVCRAVSRGNARRSLPGHPGFRRRR